MVNDRKTAGRFSSRPVQRRPPICVDSDARPRSASSPSLRCLPWKKAASTTAMRAVIIANTTMPRMPLPVPVEGCALRSHSSTSLPRCCRSSRKRRKLQVPSPHIAAYGYTTLTMRRASVSSATTSARQTSSIERSVLADAAEAAAGLRIRILELVRLPKRKGPGLPGPFDRRSRQSLTSASC